MALVVRVAWDGEGELVTLSWSFVFLQPGQGAAAAHQHPR
jgi:hypothetical protein